MSWADEHCEVTEMLRATCVHCRPAAERRRLDAVELDLRKYGAGPATREIAPDAHFEDGPIFTARYDSGTCPRCHIPFHKANLGRSNRRSFWCERCQKLYT